MNTLAVPFLLVTLMAAAAGGAFGILALPAKEPLQAAADQPKTRKPVKAKAPPPGAAEGVERDDREAFFESLKRLTLVPLKPVTVNLQGTPSVWVRIEAAVAFEGLSEKQAGVLAVQIAEDVGAFLRTAPVSLVTGPTGYSFLKDELLDRARIRSKGAAREFLITGFILE